MREFIQLLEGEIPGLRRCARTLMRDRAAADDLVQDTIARALAKEHLWRKGTSLHNWLFTILYRQRVNEIRRSAREHRALGDERVSLAADPPAGPAARLDLLVLERAIAAMPKKRREVLLLVGFEGLSYAEAATILCVPVGTVRSRLARAREALRPVLDVERGAPAPPGLRAAPAENVAA